MTLGEELVAIFHNLVSTANQVHVVFLQETRHNVGPECETDTSVVLAPAGDILVGIRPQQIAKETAVRDLYKLAGRARGTDNVGNLHPLVA